MVILILSRIFLGHYVKHILYVVSRFEYIYIYMYVVNCGKYAWRLEKV